MVANREHCSSSYIVQVALQNKLFPEVERSTFRPLPQDKYSNIAYAGKGYIPEVDLNTYYPYYDENSLKQPTE